MSNRLPLDQELEQLDRIVVTHLCHWQAAALARMNRPSLPLLQALEGLVLLAHRLSEEAENIRDLVGDFLFEDRFMTDPALAAVLAEHVDATVKYVCRMTEERHHGIESSDEDNSPFEKAVVQVIEPGQWPAGAEQVHA